MLAFINYWTEKCRVKHWNYIWCLFVILVCFIFERRNVLNPLTKRQIRQQIFWEVTQCRWISGPDISKESSVLLNVGNRSPRKNSSQTKSPESPVTPPCGRQSSHEHHLFIKELPPEDDNVVGRNFLWRIVYLL